MDKPITYGTRSHAKNKKEVRIFLGPQKLAVEMKRGLPGFGKS